MSELAHLNICSDRLEDCYPVTIERFEIERFECLSNRKQITEVASRRTRGLVIGLSVVATGGKYRV